MNFRQKELRVNIDGEMTVLRFRRKCVLSTFFLEHNFSRQEDTLKS